MIAAALMIWRIDSSAAASNMTWESTFVPVFADVASLNTRPSNERAVERLLLRARAGRLAAVDAEAIVEALLPLAIAENLPSLEQRELLKRALARAARVTDAAGAARFLSRDDSPNKFDGPVAPGGVLGLSGDTLNFDRVGERDGFRAAFVLRSALIDDRPVLAWHVGSDEPARLVNSHSPLVVLDWSNVRLQVPPDLSIGVHRLQFTWDTVVFPAAAEAVVSDASGFWLNGNPADLGVLKYRMQRDGTLPFVVLPFASRTASGINPRAGMYLSFADDPKPPPPNEWLRPARLAWIIGASVIVLSGVVVAWLLLRRAIRGRPVLAEPKCAGCRFAIHPGAGASQARACGECGANLAGRDAVCWLGWHRRFAGLHVQPLFAVAVVGVTVSLAIGIVHRVAPAPPPDESKRNDIAHYRRLIAACLEEGASMSAFDELADYMDGTGGRWSVMDDDEQRGLGPLLLKLRSAKPVGSQSDWSHPRLAELVIDYATAESLGWSDEEFISFRERFERRVIVVAPRAHVGTAIECRALGDDVQSPQVIEIDGLGVHFVPEFDSRAWRMTSPRARFHLDVLEVGSREMMPIAPDIAGSVELVVRYQADTLARVELGPKFEARSTVEVVPIGESLARPTGDSRCNPFTQPPKVYLTEVGSMWVATLAVESPSELPDPWLAIAGNWSFEVDGAVWDFGPRCVVPGAESPSQTDVLVGPFPHGPPTSGVLRFVPDPSVLSAYPDEAFNWWANEERFVIAPIVTRLGQVPAAPRRRY